MANKISINQPQDDRIILDQEVADDQVPVLVLDDELLLEAVEHVHTYHDLGGSAGEGATTTVEPAKGKINAELGIGAGVLGLSLLVAGIWWWRRREAEVSEEGAEDTIEGILDEIQSLEEAHARGELPEEEYRYNRSGLLEKLKETTTSAD